MKISSLLDKDHNNSLIYTGTGLSLSGTFKINAYSSRSYNTAYYNSTGQVVSLYNKYIINSVYSYNNYDTKGYIVVSMIPNDDSPKISYSQLYFNATTLIQSVYLNGNELHHNFQDGGGNNRDYWVDLTTGTRTLTTTQYSSGIALANNQVNFNGYLAISDASVCGSNSSGYYVTPYFKFSK